MSGELRDGSTDTGTGVDPSVLPRKRGSPSMPFRAVVGSLRRSLSVQQPEFVTSREQCPSCGSLEARPYAVFPPYFRWVICRCGLIYKVGGDTPSAAAPSSDAFVEGYATRYRKGLRRRVSKSVQQIEDALEFSEAVPGGRLLDIGCSLGYTLEAAHRLHLEPVGVDVSPSAVEHCRALGYGAEVAGLDALPFGDGAFSVVVMKHVLEHTIEPKRALEEARRVLAPGGVLFVAVPNAEYHKARKRPQASRFYRPDSPGGVEHWIYFTPKTLMALMTSAGFTVRRIHPLLTHRRVAGWRRLAEMLRIPVRWPVEAIFTRMDLRKEFWLIATAPR